MNKKFRSNKNKKYIVEKVLADSEKPEFSSGLEVEKEEELVLPLQTEEAQKTKPPSVKDQSSISGHMPDPESDDNALEAAQKMGLYPRATSDRPKELNVAKQIKNSELGRRK